MLQDGHDYMEVIGRVEPGAETESDARLKGFRRQNESGDRIEEAKDEDNH